MQAYVKIFYIWVLFFLNNLRWKCRMKMEYSLKLQYSRELIENQISPETHFYENTKVSLFKKYFQEQI